MFCAQCFQKLFELVRIIVGFGFDAEQYAAAAQSSVIDSSAMLWNASANESANETARCTARASARQCRRNRPSNDKPYARQSYGSSNGYDSRQHSAHSAAYSAANSCAVRRVRSGLDGEFLVLCRIRHEHADVITRVAAFYNSVNGSF